MLLGGRVIPVHLRKVQIPYGIRKELLDQLKEIAEKENIKPTQLFEIIVEEYIRNYDKN